MAHDSRDQEKKPASDPAPVGDNRRAGDTDGNASGGSSKSKGVTHPADQVPAPAREQSDES